MNERRLSAPPACDDDKLGHANATFTRVEGAVDALPEEEDFQWNRDVVANLFALYSIYFSSTWAMSIPSASIAFILYEFPQDQAISAWIAAAPSFALCVIQIFLGDLSDIFGRKWFLIIASLFGIIGMAVGGTATTVPIIIAGQVFNGIALTLGYLSTPLLAEVVPKRWRAPVVGGATLLVSVAGIAGQLSQGAFMKGHVGGVNKGWRIGFYIGCGLFALSFVSLSLLYRPGPRPNPEGVPVRTQILNIDWLGILLGTSSLLLLLLALQMGGQPEYPWNSAIIISFLAIGGTVLIAFAVWEWKGPRNGLFPESLFEHRNYALTLLLNFVEGMVIFSVQAFIPQVLLSLLTDDFFLSVVYNLPSAIFAMLAAGGFGILASKTKEAKWVTLISAIALTLGTGLMAVIQPNIHYMAFAVPCALIGIGIGGLGTIIPVISTICTPDRYIATAVAIGTSFRGLGGAIGVVTATQVFSSKVNTLLPKMVAKAGIDAGLPPSSVPDLLQALTTQDPALIQAVPGINEQVLIAVGGATSRAYANSYRFVWYCILPFGVLSILGSLYLKSTKEQMTLHVTSNVRKRFARVRDPELNFKEEK